MSLAQQEALRDDSASKQKAEALGRIQSKPNTLSPQIDLLET